ncbi:MAG: PPC domain-containing protein [Chloroflexi bacterium]|nr:PPC domain-containing protein [Chloroflexota bacterium]
MTVKRFGLLLTTLVAFLVFSQPVAVKTQPADIQIVFNPPVGTQDTSFTATVKNFSWNDMANVGLVAYNQFTEERVEITLPDESLNIGPRRRVDVTLPSFEPGIWSLTAEGAWINGGYIAAAGVLAVGTPGATTGELNQDQIAQGTITPFTNYLYENIGFSVWSLDGNGKSHIISLNWQANETNVPPDEVDMLLFDSTGEVAVSAEGNNLIADFMLTEETYYLFVVAYEGGITYDLTLSEPPQGDNEGGTIILGTPVIGQISPNIDEDNWSFMGRVGQVVEIRLTGQNLDGEIALTDMNGNLLASNDDCLGNNPCLFYTIPSTGQYQVKAQSYRQNSSGTYQLIVREHPDIYGDRQLFYGDRQVGSAPPGNGEAWQFAGQNGDVVTIEVMTTEDGFDPSVTLYGSDGTEIGHDDDGGEDLNALLTVPISETGVYTLVVTGYGGGSGRYWVFIDNE